MKTDPMPGFVLPVATPRTLGEPNGIEVGAHGFVSPIFRFKERLTQMLITSVTSENFGTGIASARIGWDGRAGRKRILIVDDCREVRELLEQTLARKGYEILCAGTGQDACSCARNEKPDLIIMDVGMPGPVDGMEAARILKSCLEARYAMIIILTGTQDPKAQEDAATAGAKACLLKPFSPLGLLRKIEELLGYLAIELPPTLLSAGDD